MRHAARWMRFTMVAVGLAFVAAVGRSDAVDPDKLPAPVASTFKAMFPLATIQKLSATEENGTTVYDFEFRSGERDMEADIVAEGTMIESTLVITASTIPAPAMKSIRKAARGGTLGRLEWIHTLYDVREGKAVALRVPMVKYAAEMARKDRTAEVIVGADGTVLEAPEWVKAAPAGPPAGGGK